MYSAGMEGATWTDSRIKRSVPALRPETKLSGSFFAHLPTRTRNGSLPPVAHSLLHFPQLNFRTSVFFEHLTPPAPTETASSRLAGTPSKSSLVAVPGFGKECAVRGSHGTQGMHDLGQRWKLPHLNANAARLFHIRILCWANLLVYRRQTVPLKTASICISV